ncbi:MAG: CoA ester lyase [Epsilonproteobacteria bacterium]|nr:CoA ester lyase [Campylobacterota bacterium]
MIFDVEFLTKIQEAIERKDKEFFLKRLRGRKRESRNFKIYSALLASAHNAKHLNKIDEVESDAIILNLEDGVAKEFKEIALLSAALFLQEAPSNSPLLVVRVNPLEEGGAEEIAFLNRFSPDAIRVPKIKTPKEVEIALSLVDENIFLHLSIETKEAFLNLEKLKVDGRVDKFYLGILDLLADLKIPQKVLRISNPTIDYILSRFLIVSSALDSQAISFVFQDYKNLEEFEEWCRYELEMGIEAKACITPAQVEIVNRIFKSFDIERARYIKEQFEKMQQKGITGFSDEKYGFIDEPIYKDALNILNKLSS